MITLLRVWNYMWALRGSTQRIILQLSDSPNVVKNCFFQQTEHWQTEESPSCLWWKDAKCPVLVLLLWTTSCSMRKSKTRILHSQLRTLKWRKQSLFRVLKCPTISFFFSSSFSHAFFGLIPGRGFTTFTSSKQEMTKFSLSEGKRISSKEKVPL